MTRKGPLDHILILDLSQTLAGPFASTILADLGAEVIKVERPGYGDQTRHFAPFLKEESHYFLSINRNKKSITIDLKSESGKEAFTELIKQSDVLLENFRPEVLEKLGFNNEEIKKINENIIICQISAFGRTGPLGDMPGYDILIQAMSGVMSLTGEEGHPTRFGLPIGDLVGGLYGAISILGAVVEKQRTGEGLTIDLSLLDGLVSLLGYFSGKYFLTGEKGSPVGSHHPFIVPYGTYEIKDGSIVLAVYTEAFWRKFALAMDKEEWLTDPRFSENEERVKNKDELISYVQETLKNMTMEECEETFGKYDIPFSPILNIGQILEHPQIIARGLIKEINHPAYGNFKYVGTPVNYVGSPLNNNEAPPTLGEHNDLILNKLKIPGEI